MDQDEPFTGLVAFGRGAVDAEAEQRRLEVLASYSVLDTAAEPEFDLITKMAADLFDAKTAMICFADAARLWFKAATGNWLPEIPRESAISDYIIRSLAPMTVCDVHTDPRFNHLMRGATPPRFRFYAGVPLIADQDVCLGVLLVTDAQTRAEPTEAQKLGLTRLGQLVMHQLEHRRTRLELQRITARAVRMEAIQSVLAVATTCEHALSGLLGQLCRWHKAAIGRMWKVFPADSVIVEISSFKDEHVGSQSYYYHARPTPVPVSDSHTATSIVTNQPLILRYSEIENPQHFPLLPVARAEGLTCQVSYPIWVGGERFGISMAFRGDRGDLETVLSDIASMEDLIRPTLLRKVTEERLLLLGQALDRATDGVLITDAAGGRSEGPRIIYANSGFYQMTGHTASAVIGKTPLLLKGPETDIAALQQIATALADSRPCRTELLCSRTDGTPFWVDLNLAPLRNEAGVQTHFAFILRDITQRRMQDTTQMQSEKLRTIGQLTGGIAHDFNNLLTVVTLNLEEAIIKLPLYDPLLNLLQPAMHASIRGAELTAQLTAYARRAPLRPQKVRIKTALDSLQLLIKRTLGEQFGLHVHLYPDDIAAHADPGQLENALMNLDINSRDAMPQGGVIRLHATEVELLAGSEELQEDMQPGRYTRLSVVDSGNGIPHDIIDRVFDPFFTTKEVGKGSGLGLSMVYGFARQSGGHVTLQSRRGRGTEVILFLPAVSDPDHAWQPTVASAPGAEARRVLMVEDHALVLEAVEAILTQSGFSVTSRTNAADAVALLRDGMRFDLLFTDMMLPGELSGLDLVREALTLAPAMRILVTSGYAEQSFPSIVGLTSTCEFMPKPYKRQDLLQKLRSIFPDRTLGGTFGRT